MKRQGLGDPKRKLAARAAQRLTAGERSELERYLQSKGRKMASRDVASRFGLSRSTITAYRRRLKLQLSWKEARDSEEFRTRQEELRRATRRRNLAYWAKWRAKRRQMLQQLEQQLTRLGENEPKRECVDCRERWLARREFFSMARRTRRGQTTFTMSRVCRACLAEART